MFFLGPPNIEKLKTKQDLDRLGKALLKYQKSSDVRIAAADALGELRDAKCLPLLSMSLKTEEKSDVRKAAVRAIRRIGGKEALSLLVDLLSSVRAQAEAADTLVETGELVLDFLVPKLAGAVQLKLRAEQILEQLKNLKPLANQMQGASSGEISRIYKALESNIGNSIPIEKIQEALFIYQQAVDDREEYNAKIKHGLAVLRRIGTLDALLVILEFMNLKMDNPVISMDLAATAYSELDRFDGPWPTALFVEAMKSLDARVRCKAIIHLQEKEEPNVKPLLIKALRDTDNKVRLEAVRAVGIRKYDQAFELLVQFLQDSNENFGIRAASASTLMMIRNPNAVQPLLDMLKNTNDCSNDHSFLVAVIEALGEFGDLRAIQPLRKAFNSEVYYLERKTIVQALAKMRSPQVIDALVEILLFQNKDYAKVALDALKQFGNTSIPALLRQLVLGQPYIAEALEQAEWTPTNNSVGAIFWINKGNWERCEAVGIPAVPPLIERLMQKEDMQPVIKILAELGDVRAIEPLILTLEHDNKDIRMAAAAALLNFYHRDKIDNAQKQLILANRNRIIAKHDDSSGHDDFGGTSFSDCPSDHHTDRPTHEDKGIGSYFDI